MEIRTKHFGAGFEAGFEARREGLKASLEGLKAMEYEKEKAIFFPHNVRKSRRAKIRLPSSRFQSQLLLVKAASTWNQRFDRHNEGTKIEPSRGDHFWF